MMKTRNGMAEALERNERIRTGEGCWTEPRSRVGLQRSTLARWMAERFPFVAMMPRVVQVSRGMHCSMDEGRPMHEGWQMAVPHQTDAARWMEKDADVLPIERLSMAWLKARERAMPGRLGGSRIRPSVPSARIDGASA